MGKAMTPICAGAQYRDVSTGETHGDLIRVKSVWVDEDAETQVQVLTESEFLALPEQQTIDLESFIGQIDETIIRVNSDHEAWKWRNK